MVAVATDTNFQVMTLLQAKLNRANRTTKKKGLLPFVWFIILFRGNSKEKDDVKLERAIVDTEEQATVHFLRRVKYRYGKTPKLKTIQRVSGEDGSSMELVAYGDLSKNLRKIIWPSIPASIRRALDTERKRLKDKKKAAAKKTTAKKTPAKKTTAKKKAPAKKTTAKKKAAAKKTTAKKAPAKKKAAAKKAVDKK